MRKSYHHGDLQQALLDAALTSLDRAHELPSWRALARACEVSHNAPYRHFGNVEALQVAVATECFKRLTAAVNAAAKGSQEPFARLARGLRAYIEFGRAHPSWYALMFSEVKSSDRLLQDSSTVAYGTLIHGIAACRVTNPEECAFTLWCAIHGITDLLTGGLRERSSNVEVRAQIDEVIAMCVGYVRGKAVKRR